MDIVIKKVLSEGPQNPVVARLLNQTMELLPWAHLPKEKEGRVLELYFELTKRLLKLDQLVGRLMEGMQKADEEMTANKAAGRDSNLPQILGIEGDVETFLYDAKNFLRTLLGVPNIFFDEAFDEASAFWDPKGDGRGTLVSWATDKFGPDDGFTKMLVTEQPWVGDLIRLRNAVEHPGGRSGTLYIENVALHPTGKMVLPVWWLDVGVGVNLLSDIDTSFCNLCTLAEDMLIECIRKTGLVDYIAFYEIPVEQRDRTCPKRIGVTLDHSKMKPPSMPPPA